MQVGQVTDIMTSLTKEAVKLKIRVNNLTVKYTKKSTNLGGDL